MELHIKAALHHDGMDVSGAGYVVYQYKDPIRIALDLKPHATLLDARDPSKSDGDYPCVVVLHKACKSGHGEIEVSAGWVAPAAIVAGFCGVGRAQVGGSDGDTPRETPLGIMGASDPVACTASEAIVEENSTQSCCLKAITLLEEITIATSSFCISR